MGTEATGEVLLKTPLYDTHVKYKGKIVPVSYTHLTHTHPISILLKWMDLLSALKTAC